MSDPSMIISIKNAVSIPVMAKVRIGHFVEAQIVQQCDIDYIDESEVLTPADEEFHIDKHQFKIPFVCGCRNLGEALRRINEGAAMIRTKGEAGTGNVVEAVRHVRKLNEEIKHASKLTEKELEVMARDMNVPLSLLSKTVRLGRLPVVTFAAGGIATPADAALMMQLGLDGVFVGSGIFKSENPQARAISIVQAVTNFENPKILADVSSNLGKGMEGLNISDIPKAQLFASR